MAEPEPSTTRSLASLPLLVLAGIAEALCLHCTEDPDFDRWHTPIHGGGGHALVSSSRALANLAATCKTLYDIVSPILYHQPLAFPKRHVRLLRTLISRPDLARRVKVLRLDLDIGYGQCENEDDETFVLDLAARHGWSAETNLPEYHPDRDKKVDDDLPPNLLITTCPNLEKFSMGIGYGTNFALLKPATLPRLKDVYITHSDTEMGTCLGALQELYLAAPYLETFTSNMTAGVAVDGGEVMPLGNLRHVRLDWSSISGNSLRALSRAQPVPWSMC
ncbi:hypothetical protein C8A05DRAFT_19421 [Staphylotrichum tortipilum]|uniref:Uncharacterized protein n=1 Tax=Staphylotrichum tortipilum TaxID=2831512 RepID=A0AAN6MBX2_9PEZI|nr:hypothetical protein C8A05DRAFT_19421 [Staphylotrichum longicolle]